MSGRGSFVVDWREVPLFPDLLVRGVVALSEGALGTPTPLTRRKQPRHHRCGPASSLLLGTEAALTTEVSATEVCRKLQWS